MNKVALIIGGSSGIGEAVGIILTHNNYTVYNGSRSNSSNKDINNINVDVSNIQSIKDAVNEVYCKEGQIDVLIYSAGFSMAAPIENVKTKDYQYLFAVNVFGLIEAIKFIVPIMKNHGGGRIVNISSLASKVPIPYDPYYSASKAAVDSLTYDLRIELERFNIKVSSILPGGVRTRFTYKRKVENIISNEYDDLSNTVNRLANIEQKGMDKDKVARVVYKVITDKNPPIIKVVGLKNKLASLASHMMPKKLLCRLIKKNYNMND